MSNAFNGKLNILLTCASGVEKATKKELFRLGFGDVPALNGELSLTADAFAVAKLNLNMRTADRIYVKTAEFFADTFDSLYEGVRAVRWEDYLVKDARVTVNGKCVRSKLFAVSACQSMVKKAIADRMCFAYKTERMSESGAEYQIEFRLLKDRCELLINTSGIGLHKRGYRDMVGIAPIKETLASSLILMSDYYYKRPFADPFCGSGTMAIEAAMIALNIPCGKDRKFAFQSWKNFDSKHYDIALEEGMDNRTMDRNVEIYGSDIDAKAVKLATRHAERAGLKGRIRFEVKDVKNFATTLTDGTIVTNPPYGERVVMVDDARKCYKSFGEAYKKLDGWSAFIITSAKFFQSDFGKRADRERKIFNSNKECRFFYYYANNEKHKN